MGTTIEAIQNFYKDNYTLMRIIKQKEVEIKNTCNAVFDKNDLIDAMLWYSDKPICRVKTVFIHAKYPAVSIYFEKIHIHRLLWSYWNKTDIEEGFYIHHINGDKLDARKENLEIVDIKKHQSLHNKGKKLTEEHKRKIGEQNRKRKGIKMKKRVDMPDLDVLILNGWSVSKIAKYYGCDWSTVKNRIHDNPTLLTQ